MKAVSGHTLWRYPGPQPFSESDLHRRLFFGREEEAHDLLHLILANQLVILYGKSGLGKTSLLRAGVFHQLRENGYLPLVIRVNDTTSPPLQALIAAIEDACKRQAIEFTKGEQNSLWEFFKTSIFWRGSEIQTPVLILDQFEEIFTLHSVCDRGAIADELGQLLGAGLPEAARKRREDGEELPYSDRPPLVKVLLVFREEYLGALEELSPQLPKIMETRFRLMPMNREEAKRAILKPALLPQDDEILTPSFEYSDAASNELLDFLGGKIGEVDPYTLQLLCRHVEEKIVPRVPSEPKRTIQATDLGGQSGLKKVIRTFYRQAIARLRGRRQRKRARRLCAMGLVESGHRLSLPDVQIAKTYKVRSETLDRLVDARILRRELRNGNNYYELSHDNLVQPVLKHRPWQVPRGLKIAMWSGIFVFILLFFVGITVEEQARKARIERDQAQKVLDFMIFDLRDKLTRIGQRDLLEEVINKVLEEYKQQYEGDAALETSTPSILNTLGAAFETRGDLRVGKATSVDILEDYNRAIELFQEAMIREPNVRTYQKNLQGAYARAADIHKGRGDLDKARNMWENENEILTQLAETSAKDKDKVLGRLELNYQSLGDVQMSLGNLGEAQKQFEKMQATQEDLLKQQPDNMDRQHSIAWAHMRIGEVLFAQGYQDKAMERFQAAEAAYREALTVRTKAQFPQDWARTQMNLGIVLSKQGRRASGEDSARLLQAAEVAYHEALTVYTKAQFPQDWAATQMNLGTVLSDQGARAAGADSVRLLQAAEITFREALVVYTKDHDPQNWIATSGNLAEALFLGSQFAKTRDQLAKLLDHPNLGPSEGVALLAIAIANSVALGAAEQTPIEFERISSLLSRQGSGFFLTWDFSSIKIFIDKNPRFAKHRRWLLDWIHTLESEQRDKMIAAVQTSRDEFRKTTRP